MHRARRSSSKKRPDEDDPNVTAFNVVQQATAEDCSDRCGATTLAFSPSSTSHSTDRQNRARSSISPSSCCQAPSELCQPLLPPLKIQTDPLPPPGRIELRAPSAPSARLTEDIRIYSSTLPTLGSNLRFCRPPPAPDASSLREPAESGRPA